ncbi:MAG TPA: PEP-CTERM sorting domain-containing protein [Tepidisphaeraceae bacterium]|nr:PEP-CTERM sorting domain-containing protein [Tepidisphaeraceae bacterium]
MSRITWLTAAVIAGGLFVATTGASAAVLYTTQQDFSQFQVGAVGSATHTAVATPDSDASTTNGLGNTSAAGGAGTAGAMTIVMGTFSFDNSGLRSAGEQGNAAFLTELKAHPQVSFDFTQPATPPTVTGPFFQLGIVINSSDGFGQDFPLITDPAIVNLGNGFMRETVTIPASQLASIGGAGPSFFQFGILINSNFGAGTTFTVDNIQTVVPEPASIGLLALGGLMGLRRRRA